MSLTVWFEAGGSVVAVLLLIFVSIGIGRFFLKGSSSSTDALRHKTVVVVGGSYGGGAAALPLKGKCRLIVIDTREAMHLSVSAPRAVVEPAFTKMILVPAKEIYGDSFKRGKVTRINPSENSVTLENGEEISYDYLVIATGSSSPFPGKTDDETSVEECYDLYKNAYEKVKAADRITIIGGGASGVELAGEIATDFPEKTVTVIHSRDSLIEPAVSDKLRNTVKRQLEHLNVKLVLGERVLDLASIPRDLSGGFTEVKTDKGKTVPSDLVFVCIGQTVNKNAFEESLGEAMDERGCLKVNSTLQVEGHENIFAIGDCSTADPMKMANRAKMHGELLAKNIPLHANGKAMKPYKPFRFMLYGVSVGRHQGAIQVGSIVIGSWFVKRVKCKDMFTSMLWRSFGLDVPAN